MNKKAHYKSQSGMTTSWLDWVLYIQDTEETDWLSAEDEVEKLIKKGELVEVTP